MLTRVGQLLVGPAEHGVVRFGHATAAALGPAGPVVRTTAAELRADLDSVLARCGAVRLVHAQYTDRLFGDRCEDSADLFTATSAALAQRGIALSATLHDLPTTTPAELDRRRRAAYRTVLDRCVGVVVSSQHERARLAAFAPAAGNVEVIPFPIDEPTRLRAEPGPAREVTVLGFLYPGKGHDEVLQALPAGIPMTALGRPSDGHANLVTELQQLAATLGRTLTVTGFVSDAALPAALQAAGIPVAPHRLISASGSIATWLGAGRRPLVPDVAYTRELDARCPGALWRYGGALPTLAETLRLALAEPSRTWLHDVAVGPSAAEVAARYAEVLLAWT